MTKDWGPYLKSMASISGYNVMPEVKMPKQRKARRKETRPRKQPERAFRKDAIDYLRKHGWKVMRLENGICGKNNTGFPDLWVFNRNRRYGAWIELKSSTGVLSDEQIAFKDDCFQCKVNHHVLNSMGGVKNFCDTAGKTVEEWVTGVGGARL